MRKNTAYCNCHGIKPHELRCQAQYTVIITLTVINIFSVSLKSQYIPWLILEICCTSRSLACLIISSNCCTWNVWSSFSLFKSARNIFISPRNVDALTCIDRLSFTRPENIQCISKETDNTTMTYSHQKGEVMEDGIKNTYNCFAFHSSSCCLRLKIEKQKFGCS